MRRTKQSFVLFLVLSCFAFPFLGQTSERFRETAKTIDQLIVKADFGSILPHLAAVLKMETPDLKKAMVDDRRKLSSLALAKLLEEKTNKPALSFFPDGAEPDWAALLKEGNVSDKEADEYLDNIYSEVAFLMLDHRSKKKR